MARKRKPRTNAEAASYWADGIFTNAPQATEFVNSVHVEGDTVYSFGHHFPMGKIIRRKDGKVKAVILNSDHWSGASGFANTGSDQWNCKVEAEDRIARSKRQIKLIEMPLTASSGDGMVQVRPNPSDPEPEPAWEIRREIPNVFEATDPGPEPVKSTEGCMVGQRVAKGEIKTIYYCRNPRPSDEIVETRDDGLGPTVKRWVVEVIEYVAGGGGYGQKVYEVRCPHCKAFDAKHHNWKVRYNGPRWGAKRGRGWKLYTELLTRFGDHKSWKAAALADFRCVKAARKARKEWEERNFIPFAYVSKDRDGLPRLIDNEYATFKDARAYFGIERRAKREANRKNREYIATVKAWTKGKAIEGMSQPSSISWLISNRILPNSDGTVTLYKAVDSEFKSGYLQQMGKPGMLYALGTKVTAPDYTPEPGCGHGLHFGPTPGIANRYNTAATQILACRVDVATLQPAGDKCKAKFCHVERIERTL